MATFLRNLVFLIPTISLLLWADEIPTRYQRVLDKFQIKQQTPLAEGQGSVGAIVHLDPISLKVRFIGTGTHLGFGNVLTAGHVADQGETKNQYLLFFDETGKRHSLPVLSRHTYPNPGSDIALLKVSPTPASKWPAQNAKIDRNLIERISSPGERTTTIVNKVSPVEISNFWQTTGALIHPQDFELSLTPPGFGDKLSKQAVYLPEPLVPSFYLVKPNNTENQIVGGNSGSAVLIDGRLVGVVTASQVYDPRSAIRQPHFNGPNWRDTIYPRFVQIGPEEKIELQTAPYSVGMGERILPLKFTEAQSCYKWLAQFGRTK